MSNRRLLREAVLKALYAYEVGGDEAAVIIRHHITPEAGTEKEDVRFSEDLFLRTIRNNAEYDALISGKIRNWELSRIALIDKLVLRMAVCEFLEFDDIPSKVTINEAIDIAKKYSTGKSGRFVNGLLDAILEQLVSEGKINKSGRGLVDS